MRDFVKRDTLHGTVSIYNALFQPHFNYCSAEVWDTLGQEHSKRVQKLQNGSARLIMNLSNDTPVIEALNALRWETLETQRAKSEAKQMYKVINGLAPNCLADLFSSKKRTTHYNLRDASTSLQLPLPKTENLKKSFCYSGVKLWNALPAAPRETKNPFCL